jgi:hypothetical protein
MGYFEVEIVEQAEIKAAYLSAQSAQLDPLLQRPGPIFP